jgi:hypothetical protein
VTLAAGSRLGVYDVLALIGAGRMGQVYRARDSKLHREGTVPVTLQRNGSTVEADTAPPITVVLNWKADR